MPWIIDKDFIADKSKPEGTNANAVGVIGPKAYKGNGSELSCRFRMFDDDDEVYYEGRSNNETFDPLDLFGMPNAGCTKIQYLTKNGWETL